MEILSKVLPIDVIGKVRTYHSHPVADLLRTGFGDFNTLDSPVFITMYKLSLRKWMWYFSRCGKSRIIQSIVLSHGSGNDDSDDDSNHNNNDENNSDSD